MPVPTPADREKVEQLRTLLPATQASIYLNAGTSGPLPAETVAAMRQIEDQEVRFGRASEDHAQDLRDRLDEARAVVAALLGAAPAAIALTHCTTDGVNAGLWAHAWMPGDEVVTTSLEHIAVLGSLQVLHDRFGVEVRIAEIGDGGDDGRTLRKLRELLTPRTRMLAISHVTWLTGAVLPVARIAALAGEAGAWCVVDGAQSAGAMPVDLAELGAAGVDFYAIPAQKWLLGPEGMGALYAGPRAVEAARQATAGWLDFDLHGGLPGGGIAPAPLYADARRFDATTFHVPSVAGFARSVGWLAMYVDLPWAYRRAHGLAAWVAETLARIPGVTVLTPQHQMATLVTFRVAGWPVEDAREALARRVFAIVRTLPRLDALRASVGFYNTEAELERFVGAVEELTRYTPETYPRRPELTIIQD